MTNVCVRKEKGITVLLTPNMCALIQLLSVLGGPLDLMSCRVVAAGTQEMAAFIAQEIQTIHYRRDDEN